MDLISFFTVVLVILIIAIIVLTVIYFMMSYKEKKTSKNKEENKEENKITNSYTKLSVFDFMQFDKIEDNMIIQEGGKRYLMVLQCEGVNYDLLSNVEKTAVEAGFVQFLNTLRHPIQLYTQTRTINISDTLMKYNLKLEEIKKELEIKQKQYNELQKNSNISLEVIAEAKREIVRIINLYEYGQDVISNIQKTNQNNNVLRKNYYIVFSCWTSELGTELLKEDEQMSMVFSELYTRAQSMINTLMACDIRSRVLNSEELAELLYVAYNRDDYETFGIDKALKSGYGELYSTAPDVLDKKIKALNEEIESQALQLANDAVEEVLNEKQKAIKNKERNFEEMISKLAEAIINDNKKNMGNKIAEEAIENVRNKKIIKEGGKDNEETSSKKSDSRKRK